MGMVAPLIFLKNADYTTIMILIQTSSVVLVGEEISVQVIDENQVFYLVSFMLFFELILQFFNKLTLLFQVFKWKQNAKPNGQPIQAYHKLSEAIDACFKDGNCIAVSHGDCMSEEYLYWTFTGSKVDFESNYRTIDSCSWIKGNVNAMF